MRSRIIIFLRRHPAVLNCAWSVIRFILRVLSLFIRTKEKSILFCSFGGRSFDDSPKAIYDEVCRRKEFDDWDIIWAFDDLEKYSLSRGRKVSIDGVRFYLTLLKSKVWVSNSGMDRNIGFTPRSVVRVETWHGTPLKKLSVDQHGGQLGGHRERRTKLDSSTIRCAQSEYDRDIFARIFHADKNSFLLCDLPRNDRLCVYAPEEIAEIREKLNIPEGKKIILYMPTYREYLLDKTEGFYLNSPMDTAKWKSRLGEDYIVLFRAHYAISAALNLDFDEFIRDMSHYPVLNDLYLIADILVSDYSSAFFDYAILKKPMLCFAYDFTEYAEKRGLYLDLEQELPEKIDYNEDTLLEHICTLDWESSRHKTDSFRKKYTPFAGNASEAVISEILKRL